MIKARHTFTGRLVSEYISGYRLKRAFKNVVITGNPIREDLPVLLIANHFCWWDGFIQYRLSKTVLHKKLYVMMLEEQLKKYGVLNQCGVFSVRKSSRAIIESLNYSVDLLTNKDNAVLLFPQGAIESMHQNDIVFEKGLIYILKHIKNNIQLVFNVNLIDYHSEKKPTLYIYYKAYTDFDITRVERDFNAFYQHCKSNQVLK